MTAILALPRTRAFNAVKASALRTAGASIGKRVTIYPGVFISPGRGLELGNDVDLARNVLITTSGGVSIGDRTLIGYNCHILSGNHRIPPNAGRIFGSGHDLAPVRIGSDCWIGSGVTVLPGVEIGEGAVVAAGAVVTRDLPAYSISTGVPAKVIRSRI